MVESHKTLYQHNRKSVEDGKCNRRSSDNTGTLGLGLEGKAENAASMILTEKQKVLKRDAITGESALLSPDFMTS